MRSSAMLTAGLVVLTISVPALIGQRLDVFVASRDHPAIDYSNGPVRDPVSALNRRIQEGASLTFEDASGYLRSVLAALEIPIESQVVVFSQTSAQSSQINMHNPRAIFFNDAVMVGWVRGTDHLEVAAEDLQQGVIFYTLSQSRAGKPQLKRDDSTCLQCHLTWDTLGVPGVQLLSTFPMSDDPNAYAGGFVADHRSPLEQRWGGWYVTGKSVPSRHMGNIPVIQPAAMLAKGIGLPPKLESLAGQFDTKGFPSPYSDIAALMVLEHQTHMINLLTRMGWETRVASYEAQRRNAPGVRPSGNGGEETDRVRNAARDLVDYLLFVDEAPLAGRLQGSSGFAEKFSAEGPRDSVGRSLRQLDLERRLMRYPCSYMIYSNAFDALPAAAKDAVYKRMWQILSGEEKAAPYTRLSLVDRQAIVEILRETKRGLPDYFRPLTR